jgi:hypothetical protein
LEYADCTGGNDEIFRKAMNSILSGAEMCIQNGGEVILNSNQCNIIEN